MTIAEQISRAKTDYDEVFKAGQLNVLNSSEVLKGNEIGRAVKIDDISPIEHKLGVKVASKNLFNILFFENQNCNGLVCAKNQDDTYSVKGNCAERFGYFADYDCFIPKGTTITITTNFDTNLTKDTSMGFGVVLRTISGGAIVQQNTYKEANVATVTLTEDIYKIGMVWRSANSVAGDYIEFTNIQIQLEAGTTATEYTPYREDFSGVVVSRYGKNLFYEPYLKAGTNLNAVGGNVTYNDGVITYTKSTQASNRIQMILPKEWFKEGKQYTIKFDCSTTPNIIVGTADSISDTSSFNKLGRFDATNYGTFTATGLDKAYVNIFIYTSSLAVGETATISNIQIELGSKANEYEPYIEPQTAVATADGIINGIDYLYPSLTLTTDTEGVKIECQYYKDIDKAFNELEAQIVTLGGELA